jgi:hypothetical protein
LWDSRASLRSGCGARLMLIMKIGPLPDALEPGFQCVRTQWIRGSIAFQPTRRTRIVMLMVPV